MSDTFERDEYLALTKTLADSDQRLLTVKGWGVTLSLVALGLAFQYRAYGLFLVAAISSAAFWIIEYAGKRHQIRHYLRLRQVEVSQYLQSKDAGQTSSAPRSDWSWQNAPSVLNGEKADSLTEVVSLRGPNPWYRYAWLLPYIALPHALTFAVGVYYFYQGSHDGLAGFTIGTPPAPPAVK